MRALIRSSLILALSFLIGVKIAGGVDPAGWIGPAAFWLSVLFEAAIVFALVIQRVRLAYAATITLAAVGMALAILWPESSCGCLGSFLPLRGLQHFLLSSGLGFVACVGLLLEQGTRARLLPGAAAAS